MNNSEKKLQFQAQEKSNQQNIIVVVGLWICVATVAIIFILNISARRRSTVELKRAEINQTEIKKVPIQPHYSRYSHAGYAMSSEYVTKQ